MNERLPIRLVTSWLVMLCSIAPTCPTCADECVVVLHDLTLRRVDVRDWTESGMRLSDGEVLGWDLISAVRGTGPDAGKLSEAFRERGPVLYRLRHRLELADDAWLLSEAEAEFARMASRLTTAETVRSDWIVALATWYGAVHEGRRVLASEAFLRLAWIQTEFQVPVDLGSLRPLDPQMVRRGWTNDVCPWFFDAAGSVVAIERFPREILQAIPAASVYFAGWARSAHDESLVRDGIALMRQHRLGREWAWLMEWEIRLRQEPGALDRFSAEWLDRQNNRNEGDQLGPYVRYLGRLVALDAEAAPRDVDQQILDYLWIAANAVELDSEIPAAALYRAAQWADQSGRKEESRVLRQELLDQYDRSWHGRLVASRLERLEIPDQTSDDSPMEPTGLSNEPDATGRHR